MILSADWVLPVVAPPIRDGAVAIEDGRIAAVGTRAELGAGLDYPDAAILPGFVNAHSHLEYAVYAGFGDGLAFAPWILIHVERKAASASAEMEAIARLGAAECLASGITTVGDCSFSGASATACDELGLRAIVYIEVFSRTARPTRCDTRYRAHRERIAAALSEPRADRHLAALARTRRRVELWEEAATLGLPMATHSRGERGGA